MKRWLGYFAVSIMAMIPAVAAHAQKPVIRIQDYPGSITTLIRVAVDKGYCDKHGIECQLKIIPSAPAGLQTLLAGGIDVAGPPPEVAIQSAVRGADLRIIGSYFNANPFMLLLGRSMSSDYDKTYPEVIKKLKGKKIGVTARGAGPEFQIGSMLQANGLKAEDVTFVAVGSPNTVYPALVNGQIDAAMSFVPLDGFCNVLKTCHISVVPAKDQGPKVLTDLNGAGGLLVVRADYLKDNRDTLNRFSLALKDAQEFIQDPKNFDEVTKITFKYYRLDIDKGDEILRDSLKRFLPNMVSSVDPKALQSAANYLLQTSQLSKAYDTSALLKN